jgi:L-aspartate oxidase
VNAGTSADYLIVGSGIAGLRAAVELVTHGRVLVLTKSDLHAGSTGFAQGGIAAAVGPDDSPDRHAADTIAAGDGLCDPAVVEVLVSEGPRYVQELAQWGARFDRGADGRLALAQEGAHSVRRVLHAHDATGREIARTLGARLRGHPNLEVLDHALAVGIALEDGRAVGVRYVDAAGVAREAQAGAILIATGGAGAAFRETTNPPVASGDGVVLAYLAGARVGDLEFVQFHPTALDVPGAPRYLLSEALRGEGARLVNAEGERFMARQEAAGELAPRDRVARAIAREAARTGRPVYLTLRHLPAGEVRAKFPLVTELCARVGLDLATDLLPVAPAAHYLMGGVTTDVDGRTSVPGLFAAGEVACTGVHGANRLASNSLLEGLVFGARAGLAMVKGSGLELTYGSPMARQPYVNSRPDPLTSLTDADLRDLMWDAAGIFRDQHGLDRLLAVLEPAWREVVDGLAEGAISDAAAWRTASLIGIGRLIARAAARRHESRGAHSRTDFPERDDIHFRTHLLEDMKDMKGHEGR